MTELRDGTMLQDGLNFTERKRRPADAVRYIPFPVEGQISKVIPPDDDENNDQETYLCDVHVTELGIDLFAVPWTLKKAGPDNYIHYGPVAASKNLDFTPFDAARLKPAVSDGDTVIVVFLMGDVHRPKIIAMLPHNQSGPQGMSPDPRPTGADGDCFKMRFGGTSVLLDQDGNLKIYNTSSLEEVLTGQAIPTPKTITFDLTDGVGAHTVMEFDGDTGNLDYLGSNGTHVLIDNDTDAVEIETAGGDTFSVSKDDGVQASTPSNGGTSLSMKDGQVDIVAGQGVSIDAQGGPFDITVDGDYDITSSGGGVSITAQGGDVTVDASGGGFMVTNQAGDILSLDTGKFKVQNGAGELVDNLEKGVGALVDNAPAIVLTSVGPGQLAPAALSILTQVRVFLNALKA